MKEEILKRAMFAMPLSKDARNSGILSGFDMEDMDEMEPPEPSEDMPQMARTPQNPEILMNNLRGDMRSVDARYMELAQMVGEEAAMDTPPEVLAMLQPQLAQQGGIGGLPQGQGMVPPPMQGQAPQGGAQPPQPPAQGPGMAMPQGMEGAGPFPSGGAEQAPPTPDGLPPMKAALGAFITPATRLAQMGADKLSTYGSEANALIGRLMSQGFPQTFRPVFENVRGPGGRYTAEQFLTYPTFSQHMANMIGPTATQAASRLTPGAPAVVGGTGVLAAMGLARKDEAVDPERAALEKEYENQYYQTRDRSLPMPVLRDLSKEQLAQYVQSLQTMPRTTGEPGPAAKGPAVIQAPAAPPVAAPEVAPEPAAEEAPKTTADFIKANLATPATGETKSRIERIKEARAEYAPLYKELLGDTKEDMYVNAMLMLADAGFKYASLPAKSGTTPISLLAQAAQGLPQGFMALLAQAKQNQIKVDTAALTQAVSDVQEQDKQAQRLKELMLKGDYDLLKEQAKQGGVVTEDAGAGLLSFKTKGGSFLGVAIDPSNPTVQTAIKSRYTLRPTDNPYVENLGEAPTTFERNTNERVKLTTTMRGLDDSLKQLDQIRGQYAQLYSPGTWFQDKVNNLLVPISGGVIRPDVDQVAAATQIRNGLNSVTKRIASANDSGRVAVQEQEWVRDMLSGLDNPTAFFSNKDIAAKQFATMEAQLRNARQQVLTQLGFEKNDYVMKTPNTGTQSDPFVIPTDPDAQQRMFNFLGSTIGKIQDPRAMVFVRMPNNTVQAFNPTQLRGLIQ